MGSRQIEMTWQCSSCSFRNLGRYQRCQQCDDPKDGSETYEMPSETASAPTVTDAALLRMATAGPNWRCAFCGSHQRRDDGACKQCGAPADRALEELETRATARAPLKPWQRVVRWARGHKVAVGIGVGLLALILTILWVRRERTYGAQVEDVEWTQTITVERYQIWTRDGWRTGTPSDAFEVESLGQQIHHYDDVLDGYDTQYYSVQVACGEDCRDEPQSCSEHCTSNNNGFATCNTTCSGGGRRCTTRYCTEQRSREVPRYRKEPRYAEAIRYKIWDWGAHRTVQATGHGTTGLRWPLEEAKIGQNLADREQEREQRSAVYTIKLKYDDTKHLTFGVPLEELSAFAIGTQHELRVKQDRVVVDGKQRVKR